MLRPPRSRKLQPFPLLPARTHDRFPNSLQVSCRVLQEEEIHLDGAQLRRSPLPALLSSLSPLRVQADPLRRHRHIPAVPAHVHGEAPRLHGHALRDDLQERRAQEDVHLRGSRQQIDPGQDAGHADVVLRRADGEEDVREGRGGQVRDEIRSQIEVPDEHQLHVRVHNRDDEVRAGAVRDVDLAGVGHELGHVFRPGLPVLQAIGVYHAHLGRRPRHA